MMKIPTLALFLIAAPATQAATVYAFWSAQTLPNGGSYDPNLTAGNFPTTPILTVSGASVTTGAMPGGASSYTFDGTTWTGSGNASGSGFSFGWNSDRLTVGQDNHLTIALDLTSVQDLSLRMDIRSASGNQGSFPRITTFEAISYSLDSGATWQTAATGTALAIPTSANNFVAYNLDLSDLDAIEGQSNVMLRLSPGDVGENLSFRMDNILVSGEMIPEPSAALSALVGVGLLALRRKRA